MTAEMAALVEPLSIGVYSVGLSSLRENEKIGILGSGPIGLSVLVSALDRGAQRAYVTDPIPNRLETASRAGACWTGNPHEEDIVARIEEQEPLLLDTVFECSGEQEALDQAVDLLKPGGKLVVVGIPELDRVSFSIDKIRRKELCIQNVRRQNNCVRKAIDLLDRNPEYADLIISHHFRLSEAVKAFDLVRNYEDGVIKAIIKP
jgi:threonine dehydrogenase-like Zn-dependent dehydrogenase